MEIGHNFCERHYSVNASIDRQQPLAANGPWTKPLARQWRLFRVLRLTQGGVIL
jgi:hypothetical protein